MTPASLQTSEPMMQQCVERLITRLVRSADSGEPVDMRLALADMTLEAIGFAAFGIDLHCQDGYESITAAGAGDDGISKSKEWLSKPGSREFGREVTKVARVVLKVADPAVGSAWKLPVSVFEFEMHGCCHEPTRPKPRPRAKHACMCSVLLVLCRPSSSPS